jgi:hypothetical protein
MRTYFWISLFISYRITENLLIASNVILIANKQFYKKSYNSHSFFSMLHALTPPLHVCFYCFSIIMFKSVLDTKAKGNNNVDLTTSIMIPHLSLSDDDIVVNNVLF